MKKKIIIVALACYAVIATCMCGYMTYRSYVRSVFNGYDVNYYNAAEDLIDSLAADGGLASHVSDLSVVEGYLHAKHEADSVYARYNYPEGF